MTADQLADRLHARRAGSRRWMARCPAHQDREPSLSIREGRDGRILLHCFAGCAVTSILESVGLGIRDLFPDGPAPSPEEMRQLAREREQRDHEAWTKRHRQRLLIVRCRKLERIVDSLGAKLARTLDDMSEGEALTGLFHQTLDRLRAAEAELEARL